jgi:hypothetical protein
MDRARRSRAALAFGLDGREVAGAILQHRRQEARAALERSRRAAPRPAAAPLPTMEP